MKRFFYWMMFLIPLGLLANNPVGTMVDFLRGTPAWVGGHVELDESLKLYQGSYGLFSTSMSVKAKKLIHFSATEKTLHLRSDDALEITVGGIPYKINELSYNDQSKKFSVKTNAYLGFVEKRISGKIEEVLNSQYKERLIRAFGVLKTMRRQESLRDANAVVQTILGILSRPETPPLPVVRGFVNLGFTPAASKNLKLDQWTAQIQRGDTITFGMDFTKGRGPLVVNGVEVRSQQGIRIVGKTKFPELNSLNFGSMIADQKGIKFNYDLGPEEVIAGFSVLIQTLRAIDSNGRTGGTDCDPVRLERIRQSLDGNLKREIALMIRKYRKELINAGANPALLAVLD
jgi:hypothetical protein